MRILFRILVASALIFSFTACDALRNLWNASDRRLARIGTDVLYESEVKKLLPAGITPEDSASMVQRYIEAWSLSRLIIAKAEEQLSKADRDVSAQMEEYRKSLLGYRYEQQYVEERLDTAVTRQEIEEYYNSSPQNFVTDVPVIKGRVIRILTKSPYYEQISKSCMVTDKDDVKSLESLCFDSAEKYNDFGKQWVPVQVLAKECGISTESCENRLKGSDHVWELVEGPVTVLVFIEHVIGSGEMAPLDYYSERIRESIVSKRKQALLSKLERDLLDDALVSRKLKIYEYDD